MLALMASSPHDSSGPSGSPIPGFFAVVPAGGAGTRLWPLSREAYPKQFLPLVGDDTMLQATRKRVASIAGAAPLVVANQEHRFMAAAQLRDC